MQKPKWWMIQPCKKAYKKEMTFLRVNHGYWERTTDVPFFFYFFIFLYNKYCLHYNELFKTEGNPCKEEKS